MKMRRHRVFLLCTVGLCVISFLHYYKALHYVSLLRELSAPYPNIKSFIMVTGFFWKERTTPLSSILPEGGLAVALQRSNTEVQESVELPMGDQQFEELQSWEKSEQVDKDAMAWYPSRPVRARRNHQNEAAKRNNDHMFTLPDPTGPLGDLHRRSYQLRDDATPYFVRTKAGALCFRQGTEMAVPKDGVGRDGMAAISQRKILHQQETVHPSRVRPRRGEADTQDVPRRVINAINVNHEFDLLHVRFHELAQAVDLFLVCESNFTAYGESRPLQFLRLLLNGTYDYVRHKILYVFLDHFPEGGRQDGWIADDYLRTFLTRNGMSRVVGMRPDDVFIINDADEIPAQEGILFLKLFDGWTEPFAIHMRKSLYGFFWKQLGSLEVLSGCTVGMLKTVYDRDGIKLRRREYYTMPGFRQYENDTGHILVQWSIGSPFHYAGWHCSWCFTPEGIHHKLISAQNGDFPRWGDYEDKRDLNYIRELIRTGGWFDGSVQEYPPSDPKEHMYAPKYLLDNYNRYRYMLENPYAKQNSLRER
ncbi:hypothetical protein AGOR_G00227120 [Albula goreensis]|uniref:Beta-1,4-mannosyl-glycoprotein 4-beta-N-acetylglucosaminyltransferase n=1 Tax=Albula goreensis TaxID=1534307 RepID=A0A8T3CL08_9TELE|nr:hypothetical protein AGOR_G00227120 [Albula goreensis]